MSEDTVIPADAADPAQLNAMVGSVHRLRSMQRTQADSARTLLRLRHSVVWKDFRHIAGYMLQVFDHETRDGTQQMDSACLLNQTDFWLRNRATRQDAPDSAVMLNAYAYALHQRWLVETGGSVTIGDRIPKDGEIPEGQTLNIQPKVVNLEPVKAAKSELPPPPPANVWAQPSGVGTATHVHYRDAVRKIGDNWFKAGALGDSYDRTTRHLWLSNMVKQSALVTNGKFGNGLHYKVAVEIPQNPT